MASMPTYLLVNEKHEENSTNERLRGALTLYEGSDCGTYSGEVPVELSE
jgi:hypothetical protein